MPLIPWIQSRGSETLLINSPGDSNTSVLAYDESLCYAELKIAAVLKKRKKSKLLQFTGTVARDV
jgi:hypothetical protein